VVTWIVFLLAGLPLYRVWLANRTTSLSHAVLWASAAWMAWLGLMSETMYSRTGYAAPITTYLALCLTGCTGVAVLGARRPGVGAWNFVLLGLLAVMLLPVAQHAFLGGPTTPALELEPVWFFFLAATITVGALNYLPTIFAVPACLVEAACVIQVLVLSGQVEQSLATWWLMAAAPWAGLLCWHLVPRPDSEFDRIWLDFRDRHGAFWGERLREQFNRSAANAGWPVVLHWGGLRPTGGANRPDEAAQKALVETLGALLKRFTFAGSADSCWGSGE